MAHSDPRPTRRPAAVAAHHPTRDILYVIVLKLLLLAALSQLFFKPSDRPRINDDSIARHLLAGEGGKR